MLDTLSFVQLLMDPGPQRTGLDQISTLGVCVGGGSLSPSGIEMWVTPMCIKVVELDDLS